jgi:pantoate kinase
VVHVYLYEAADAINKAGKDAINAFAEGDELRMLLLGLKRFAKSTPFNSKEANRRIARKLIAEGKYPL